MKHHLQKDKDNFVLKSLSLKDTHLIWLMKAADATYYSWT